MAGWDQLYVPYCDGSLFAGDTDIDDDGDGEVDRHRGLMNLSAALGVATASFPDTSRVVLAGSSGGGYGTLTAAVLTRFAFPDAEIAVINDAGVGLGLGDDPAFVWDVIDESQAHDIVPASQASLLDGGHLTPLLGWQLSEDPRLRVSAISARQDYVISQMYLGVPATFEGWLVDELGMGSRRRAAAGLAASAPSSSRATHTTLLGDPAGFVDEDSSYYDAVALILGSMDEVSIGGETVASWLDGFVSGDLAGVRGRSRRAYQGWRWRSVRSSMWQVPVQVVPEKVTPLGSARSTAPLTCRAAFGSPPAPTMAPWQSAQVAPRSRCSSCSPLSRLRWADCRWRARGSPRRSASPRHGPWCRWRRRCGRGSRGWSSSGRTTWRPGRPREAHLRLPGRGVAE